MTTHCAPSRAVLLVNLGTPAAPTATALRRFLGEFLADRRVVDVPRFIWYPILYGIILPFRPYKVLPLYEQIWIKKTSGVVINGKCEGSPLTLYTESVAAKVRAVVAAEHGDDVVVRLAMRYGANNIPAVLQALQAEHPSVRELVVVPLFPQYSSTTSACIYDSVFQFYMNKKCRCVPALRTIRDYADHPVYIEAMATRLLDSLQMYVKAKNATSEGWKSVLMHCLQDAAIVITYHSIPVRYVQEGDDYPQRCEVTTRAIQAFLEKETGHSFAEHIVHVYQSQFGNQPWIGPKLVEAAAALPAPSGDPLKVQLSEACGVAALRQRVVRVCFALAPGFAVDCVETVQEIGIEAADLFKEHGGEEFIYVPCLNDSEGQVNTIAAVVREAL